MGTKAVSTVELSETLRLSECRDGFWLYDDTRGMNLAIREKTKDAAFVRALKYYQKRLKDVEENYKALKTKVDFFIDQFTDEEGYYP